MIRRKARLRKRLRRSQAFDQTLRELRFYRQYERFYGDDIWAHVPRCYGMVTTDLGPGLAVEFVGNHDGTPAERISTFVKEGMVSEVRPAIDTFRAFLRQTLLLTHELRLQNLVLPRLADGAFGRVYIIDAIGLPDWIPLAYWWKWLARRRVDARIERFDRRISRLAENID